MNKTKLSVAALLLSASIVAAQEVHAPTHAPAHAPAPVAVPVAAPAPAPAVVEAVPAPAVVEAPAAPVAPVVAPAAPVVAPAAPVVVAMAEPAPVAKPAEMSATVAGTKISLYGRLELNAAFEDGLTSGLWTANAPKNANKDAQGRTTFSAARTRFGFNLEGPSKDDEPSLKGKFEADFAGSSAYDNFRGSVGTVSSGNVVTTSGFRLRQSWGSVTYKDIGLTILFGQTDDVVNPLDPPSINPSSFNATGNIGNRRPQIRITEAIGPVEVAVAATHDRIYNYTARLDKDSSDANTDKSVSERSNPPAIPAFQGRVGLKLPATWAGEKANFALGVGGLYGSNKAADDTDKSYASPEPAYMFGADLSLPIIDILTLTGEFFTGQNLSRYEGSLGQSRAYSKDGGIKSIGWWGGLAAKLPANFSANAGVGAESLDDKSKTANGIESSMFIFGNVAYNFTSAAKVTFEYVNLAADYTDTNGKDTDKSNAGHLNRFELNFRYDFK